MLHSLLKAPFSRRLVYLLCCLMVLGGQPLMALEQNIRIVPKEDTPDWLETWGDGATYRDAWDATTTWSRDVATDLHRQLDTWWDGTWIEAWDLLDATRVQQLEPHSAAAAGPTGAGSVPVLIASAIGQAGDQAQDKEEESLSDEELKKLAETDSLARPDEAPVKTITKAEPMPNAEGLKVGGSSFRPPKELIQQLDGKADLDNIPLIPGLNLGSLPEEPASTDPATVFNAIGGAYTKVWVHELCDTANPWKIYDPNDPSSSDLTEIDHTNGFWIEATTPVDLPSDGTLPATTTFQLCPGWNQIGYPADQPRHVTNALHTIEGQYIRVFGYDASDADDPWEVYGVGVPEWANDLQFMQPGRGYWVLVTEATTLTIANEGPDPVVEITSPEDLGVVTDFTDVIGTVQSPILDSWRLTYERVGETEPVEIASGVAPVAAGGVLGTFDPTLLINGLYELKLEAIDLEGRVVEDSVAVAVEGGMKIGHFVLPLLDMTLPVVGIPLDVVRTYDSRDKEIRDFGYGWSLQLSQFQVQENQAPGVGWQGVSLPGSFPTYCIEPETPHLVAVTYPNGEVARFRPVLEPQCQTLVPQQVVTLRYEPVGGTVSELVPLGLASQELLVVGSFPGPISLYDQDLAAPHDPNAYRLTTADRAKLEIDEEQGLQRIEQANGNSLTITPEGIEHSGGFELRFERDSLGRIERIVDAAGYEMTYEYDSRGDLTRVKDREDRYWHFRYAEGHYLTALIDPTGREFAAFEYDGENRLAAACESETRCRTLTHDLEGNREVLTDATGRQVTAEYDSRGNVVAVTDGLGHIKRFEYDPITDDLVREIDPAGGVTDYVYDSAGRLTSRTTPHPEAEPAENFTTRYSYEDGRLQRVDFPTGAANVMIYDDSGNLIRQEDENGNLLMAATYGPGGVLTSEAGPFGSYSYSGHGPNGLPGVETDPFGVNTSYSYTANGDPLTIEDPFFDATFTHDRLGRRTHFAFDTGVEMSSTYGLGSFPTVTEGEAFGRQERVTGPAGRLEGWNLPGGRTTSFEHDAAGRLTKQTGPLGRTHRVEYDAAGRISLREDTRGAQTTYERDSVGRATVIRNALDHKTSLSYDEAGRVSTITDSRGNTRNFSYGLNEATLADALGHSTTLRTTPHLLPRQVVFPDGNLREVDYLLSSGLDDAESYPTRIRDESGRERLFGYTEYGSLEAVTDLSGASFELVWDERLGLLESMTGPTGRAWSWQHDAAGRVAAITAPDGGTTQLSYGSRYTLDSRTSPSGSVLNFGYDEAFRMTTRTSSEGATAVWDYNQDDTVARMIDDTGTTEYHYDDAGALSGIDQPSGASIRYERDILGRVVEVAVKATPADVERVTAYAYDEVGNLVSVTDPLGGATTMVYDEADRLTERTLPNGATSKFEYDLRNRISKIEHLGPQGQILRSLTYEREPTGAPTKITQEDGSYVALDYDAGFRISRELYYDADGTLTETLEYGYDAAGNRTSMTQNGETSTYSYGPGHRLTSVSGPTATDSFAYDADGRQVEISRDSVTFTLSYNALDELVSVQDGGGQQIADYSYDADGRRTAASSEGTSRRVLVAPTATGSLDQRHLMAGAQGELLAGWVHAGGEPILRYDDSGEARYYLTDAAGSIVGMLDGAGELVSSFEYDSFGNLRQAVGEALGTESNLRGDFGFHGGWLEPATGLYHFRARYYEPQTGRFTSRDLAGVDIQRPESLNAYSYAYSNPQVFADPTGLMTVMSLNVSMSLNDILTTMRTAAANYVRNEAKDKVGETVGDFLFELFSWFLPLHAGGISTAASIFGGGDPGDEGDAFELVGWQFMCDMIEASFPSALQAIWLEVELDGSGDNDERGRALNNGLRDCGSVTTLKPPTIGTGDSTKPDYLFSNIEPGKGFRSTFLIGDFKRSAKKVVTAGGKNQFRNVVYHARNYGFLLAVYITLQSGTPKEWAWAQQFAVTENQVAVFVVSLN